MDASVRSLMATGSPQDGQGRLVRSGGRVVGSLGTIVRRGVEVSRRRIRKQCACAVIGLVKVAVAPVVGLGAAPVCRLATGRGALALVGPAVQGGGADRAAASRHGDVTARVPRL